MVKIRAKSNTDLDLKTLKRNFQRSNINLKEFTPNHTKRDNYFELTTTN